MVMFVLIQFDVFGYDLIYATVCDDERSVVLTLDDESSISDSQGEYAEWSDPSYRTSSVRFFFDSVYPIFSIPIYSFEYSRLGVQPYVYENPVSIKDCQSYIMFRALLI